MPFCHLRLRGPRSPDFPIVYPRHPKTLGEHIRKQRLDLGLRQRTLAERLGVRTETLAMWERGQAGPLARHYGAIVRFLGYDPEPEDWSLPGRLRTIRRRLGLSQADFAAKVGLDEGSVCRWESGSRKPSRWMENRVGAILDRLEAPTGSACVGDTPIASPPLTYFDRTRWRRRPPPDLIDAGPVSLGDRLRYRRLELGLSQEQLGKILGVGRVSVYRWEGGQATPPACHKDVVRKFVQREEPPVGKRLRRAGQE